MERLSAKQRTRRSIWQRALAVFLAFLLVLALVLSYAVRVNIRRQAYTPLSNNLDAAAINYLVDSTEYLREGFVSRLRRMLPSYYPGRLSAEEYYQRASEAIAKEKYGDALANINACLSMVSSEDASYEDLKMKQGCLFALLGRHEQALEAFETVLQDNPQNAQTNLLCAQVYAELGDIYGAVGQLERYLELTPDDLEMQLALVQLYYLQGSFERTDQAATEYLARAEQYAENAYFLRGASRVQLGSLDLAIQDFQVALDAGYEGVLCLEQMAICAFLLGDNQSTLDYGNRALELAKTSNIEIMGEVYGYMGFAALILKENESAVQHLTSAIGLATQPAQLYYYRGVSYMAMDDLISAAEDFTTAIDNGETTVLAYYNRGACYLALGKSDLAKLDMQKVVELDADAELTKIAKDILK